ALDGLQDQPVPRDLGRPADPPGSAAPTQAPAAPLAARRLGAVRLERLPRPALVPDDRPLAHSGLRGDAVGSTVRDVLRWRPTFAFASRRAPRATSMSGGRAPRCSTGSSPVTTAAPSSCASRTPTARARPTRTSAR